LMTTVIQMMTKRVVKTFREAIFSRLYLLLIRRFNRNKKCWRQG
jgi:hypothetical protein